MDQKEITSISKKFANGFKPEIKSISGSGFLIVDPLSAYLDFCGYENTVQEIASNEKHPQVLVITFENGNKFIPAGGDLDIKGAKNWMWI